MTNVVRTPSPVPSRIKSPLPVTICVLCYGPNYHLAERFLSSLYRHTDPRFFCLRAGLNEVFPETSTLFAEYSKQFQNIDIIKEPKNVFKNPLMRRLFIEQPLTTEWVIWFDDDTHVTRSDWLQRLTLKIECFPNVVQWGKIYQLDRCDEEILRFIRTAPWFRNVPMNTVEEFPGDRNVRFRFATGGFWALKTEVIHALDWPDRRLIQANDDFLLGEALRQNGCPIGSFHRGVAVNDHPRRNEGADELERLPVNIAETAVKEPRSA